MVINIPSAKKCQNQFVFVELMACQRGAFLRLFNVKPEFIIVLTL